VLLISCPCCGPRAETEFTWGGEAHVVRPQPTVDDESWADYLHMRHNPRGRHRERWLHARGCGQWFNLVRDTLTHEILDVYPMGAPPPEAP